MSINLSRTGITFVNLNVDDNIWYLSTNTLSIHRFNGDTTFLAFKTGGEATVFAYYNSDSMATVAYEAVFPQLIRQPCCLPTEADSGCPWPWKDENCLY